MFTIDIVPEPLRTYVLSNGPGACQVAIVPERGGLVTSLKLSGRELLFLDRQTLLDKSKNVRGGIPVLFPIAGKLADDQYVVQGRTLTMRQHGFARNLPWDVVETSANTGEARMTLTLESSPVTRESFPWDFVVRLTYVISPQGLAIEQEYENRSTEPMPLHAGFHPYFRVPSPSKTRVRVDTHATRAWDNVHKQFVNFTGFDFAQPEVDVHLLDPHPPGSVLRFDGIGDGGNDGEVRLQADGSFPILVVWSLRDKDFVCVEPWTAPGNALNTKEKIIEVAPRGVHRASVGISLG